MSIKVVVGYPHSDIGKGWITSSMASHEQDPLILKIDPALMRKMPDGFGVLIEGEYVTTDAATYLRRGHTFSRAQNFFMGELILDTVQRGPMSEGLLSQDQAPVPTYADVSHHLAAAIDKTMTKVGTVNAIIEVGGCPDDLEAAPIPGAIRYLHRKYGADITLLTAFGFSKENGDYFIKTRGATRAIETAMSTYWGLPLDRVYIRRAGVLEIIDDAALSTACTKVAFRTQLDPTNIIYIPDINSPEELDKFTLPRRA